ncbi:MAG TPA: hypothetical protein VF784_11365 [Anaerolineales bacterium]
METKTRDGSLDFMDAWNVTPDAFPLEAGLKEQLSFVLNYAILAPSIHNAQPWLFAIKDNEIELFADRTRALPVVDPDDRELTIGCGAALFNLRIAMRMFGYRESVDLFPEPGDRDLLARVTVHYNSVLTSEDRLLFDAIPHRHTNRRPFERRAVSPALVVALEGAADDEGAWLHAIDEPGLHRAVVDLVKGAELMLWKDRRFRRELAAWIHPRRHGRGEGISGSAAGLADLASFLGPENQPNVSQLVRTGTSEDMLDTSPGLLAVLGTPGDSAQDWVSAGQAMERVLLRAQAGGVSASFLNGPIEVRDLRPRLRDVIEQHGFPQILLRLGYGQEVEPAPRRPISEVVLS